MTVKFGFGRVTKVIAVLALAAAPAIVLVSSELPAGATTAGTEAQFRAAFADTAETLITLTAPINLTCAGGPKGEAARGDTATGVTIDGAGFTITQTCDTQRVLKNGTGELTLQNVTITGGTVHYHGSGVLSKGSVTLDNATVTNNSALGDCGDGGGVWVGEDGNLTMTNASAVTNNSATCSGGGVYVKNGTLTVQGGSTIANNQANDDRGGFYSAGLATITDSEVSGNQAKGGEGGGGEGEGGVTATNSTFSNNTATGEGGGFESEGPTTVTNTSFIQNQANDDGGGFNNDGSSSDAINVVDSTFSGNITGDDGGGFDVNDGATANVSGSTFTGNAAPTSNGGAIAIEDNSTAVTVTNSTVTGQQPGLTVVRSRRATTGETSLTLRYDTITNNSVTVGVTSLGAVVQNKVVDTPNEPEHDAHAQVAGAGRAGVGQRPVRRRVLVLRHRDLPARWRPELRRGLRVGHGPGLQLLR